MYPDFKELLSAFNVHDVRYLIVGGYAVSIYAQPRATKDPDLLIDPSAENARAVHTALAKFGAPIQGLSPKDFIERDSFFRMGAPPAMVDIIPHIKGVDFTEAWKRRVTREIDDGLLAHFISREDLLVSKIAAGRLSDLADVEALRGAAEGQAAGD